MKLRHLLAFSLLAVAPFVGSLAAAPKTTVAIAFGGRHPQPIDAPQSLHLALTHAPVEPAHIPATSPLSASPPPAPRSR